MKVPYTCCRCGYTTDKKTNMHKHLFQKKKTCPGMVNDIELTEHIKNKILDNHIYKLPEKPAAPQIINNIQNNNKILYNNFAKQDVFNLLTKYHDYKGTNIMDFGTMVEDMFEDKGDKIDMTPANTGGLKYQMNRNDFINILDSLTKSKSIDQINILYTKQLAQISILDGDNWEHYMMEQGLARIVELVQRFYLDKYEFYLIRNAYHSNNAREKQHIHELLSDYYTFISCFDPHVKPYVIDKKNSEILYNTTDDNFYRDEHKSSDAVYSIQDEYTTFYKKKCESIKKAEKDKTKKVILTRLKTNIESNIKNVHSQLVSMFNMDEDFKQHIAPVLGA